MEFALIVIGITVMVLLVFNALSLFDKKQFQDIEALKSTTGLSGEAQTQKIVSEAVLPDEVPEKLSPIIALIKETNEKLLLAGLIYPWQKWCFGVFQITLGLFGFTFVTSLWYSKLENEMLAFIGGIVAGAGGFKIPLFMLERSITKNQEAIRDHFPVLIDDILISVDGGVSISAAISALVSLSKENNDANPAIQIFETVLNLVKGGMSLGEAFVESAKQTKITEVKHALRLLASCEINGGDVKGQLTALADGLLFQKQINMEEKLVQLPVKASLPLALVFAGLFAFLFARLFSTIANVGFETAF